MQNICTQVLKFMCIHCLCLCMCSVHVCMYPVDLVPIVTAISRVCLCCVVLNHLLEKRGGEKSIACQVYQLSGTAETNKRCWLGAAFTCFNFTWQACLKVTYTSCSFIISSNINIVNKGKYKSLEIFMWLQSEELRKEVRTAWVSRDMIQKVTSWCSLVQKMSFLPELMSDSAVGRSLKVSSEERDSVLQPD